MNNYQTARAQAKAQGFPSHYVRGALGFLVCNRCGKAWNRISINMLEELTETQAIEFRRGRGCPKCRKEN